MTENPTILTLTPAAVARVKTLMQKEEGVLGIRVGIAVKGCSGFVHTLDYAREEDPADTKLEQEGAVVFITPKAMPIVFGTTLDWVDQDLEQRFTFKNPNAKGTCGCGESFYVDD